MLSCSDNPLRSKDCPMTVRWLALFGCVCVFTNCAAAGPPRTPAAIHAPGAWPQVTAFTVEPSRLTLQTTAGTLSIAAVSDHVIRVHGSPEGAPGKDFSWAVVAGANAPKGTLTVKDDGAVLRAWTANVHVRIEKDPLRIVFLDEKDEIISQDDPHRPMSLTQTGFRVDRAMPEGEHYFGLGDKAGPLDRRDMAFTNWNTDAYDWQESTDPLYKTIPFFIGLRNKRALWHLPRQYLALLVRLRQNRARLVLLRLRRRRARLLFHRRSGAEVRPHALRRLDRQDAPSAPLGARLPAISLLVLPGGARLRAGADVSREEDPRRRHLPRHRLPEGQSTVHDRSRAFSELREDDRRSRAARLQGHPHHRSAHRQAGRGRLQAIRRRGRRQSLRPQSRRLRLRRFCLAGGQRLP